MANQNVFSSALQNPFENLSARSLGKSALCAWKQSWRVDSACFDTDPFQVVPGGAAEALGALERETDREGTAFQQQPDLSGKKCQAGVTLSARIAAGGLVSTGEVWSLPAGWEDCRLPLP